MSAPPGSRARRITDYAVYRIKATDTNKFAVLADPAGDGTTFVSVIEIFDVGGKTPPNAHRAADELFYVLHGEGRAQCNGAVYPVQQGESFLVRAGHEHIVENTGSSRLYCLTTMVPNESFAELIRGGIADTLDAEDLAVLMKRRSP